MISGHCDLDPIGDWVVGLLHDAYEDRPPAWPAVSKGLQVLLPSSQLEQGRDGAPASEAPPARDLQGALDRRMANEAEAPRTAVCVHKDLQGLICAAQVAICMPAWFQDPTQAVVICADENEVREIETLLRTDYDQQRGEDLLEAAKDLAEGLMAPSPEWRYSGPGPVVLVSEIPPGAGWREVFLSPRCRGLNADQLLPAVRAARVGVHVVAEASRH